MNFAVAATVFPIIFVGELPDKTMFASLVMSTRGKPMSVWLGAAAAFALHVAIATTIGVAIFNLLPHRAVDEVVAFLFLGGAALAVREGQGPRRRPADRARGGFRPARRNDSVHRHLPGRMGRPDADPDCEPGGSLPLTIVGGPSVRWLTLWAVAALAVIGGQGVLRFVSIRTVRFVTAGLLVLLAGYAGWQAVR